MLLDRATEHLFGYPREELLGAPVEMLLPGSIRERHVRHRATYPASPSTRPRAAATLAARRRDGTEFPMEVSLVPIRSDDSFSVIAIIRDVTERRDFEERIRKANQELEARNREIEKANHLKSEFLASMSHELRTPLHTIIGFTELIQEESQGPLNAQQKRFVGHVHHDSVHLLELINDILDLSKIEAEPDGTEPRKCRYPEVIEEAVTGSRPLPPPKILRSDRNRPACFHPCRRIRFREIMTNLLSNAVKFTPKGGRVWIDPAIQASIWFRFRFPTGVSALRPKIRKSFLTASGRSVALPAGCVKARGWVSRLSNVS